jgi:hypothetical protein
MVDDLGAFPSRIRVGWLLFILMDVFISYTQD